MDDETAIRIKKKGETDEEWLERMKLGELPDPPRYPVKKPKWRMD